MKFKMIVMDMDDTLLRDDLSISEKTASAIKAVQKTGAKVILASGRPEVAMYKYAEHLHMHLHDTFLISYNGAKICRLANENTITSSVIYKNYLNSQMANYLYDLSKDLDVFIHTYRDGKIVTPKNNKYTKIEKKITGMDIIETENFCDYLQEGVVKLMMLQDPEKLAKIQEHLKPLVSEKVNMFTSKPYFLEFMENGVDKATGVAFVADKLGILVNEVICIGDSYNDLGMIKYAGLGVAMGNAPIDIKDHANYIAPDNMSDGVAHVIEKFTLSA